MRHAEVSLRSSQCHLSELATLQHHPGAEWSREWNPCERSFPGSFVVQDTQGSSSSGTVRCFPLNISENVHYSPSPPGSQWSSPSVAWTASSSLRRILCMKPCNSSRIPKHDTWSTVIRISGETRLMHKYVVLTSSLSMYTIWPLIYT